jgi:hypothetical protein
VKPNHKDLLLRQKINTTDRLLDSQTFLHLPRFNIPEPDCLVITSTDQSLAAKEESRAEIGVSMEEAQALRKRVCKVGFTVVEGTVERFPVATGSVVGRQFQRRQDVPAFWSSRGFDWRRIRSSNSVTMISPQGRMGDHRVPVLRYLSRMHQIRY